MSHSLRKHLCPLPRPLSMLCGNNDEVRTGLVLDKTVASEGAPANRSCKTPRVAPIMVTDGRTDSRKFKQLVKRVRLAREYARAKRVAVE